MTSNKTFSRLLQLAKTEQRSLLWGLFFLLLSSGSSLTFPQIIRWFLDNVIQPQKLELLLPTALGLFFLFVLQGVAGSLRYYFFTLSGEKIVLHLRQKLYAKIVSQDVPFFDVHRTGDLMSQLSSDCGVLQNTVSVNLSMGLRFFAQVLGGLAFMFYTSWKLSLIMVLLIPFVGLLTFFYGKKIRQSSQQFQQTLSVSSIVAEETLSGIKTVKAFVQEQRELSRYAHSLTSALEMAKRKVKGIAFFMTYAMILGFASISFILWFGGQEVIGQRLSLGDLTQFLLYLMIVAIGVGSLGNLWGDIMAGVGASKRIFELLEIPEAMKQKGIIPTQFVGHVELSHVSFAYPTRPTESVLSNIHFSIPAGKTAALVGLSGSGKSTIAQLILQFYQLSSGRILFDQLDSTNLDVAWLRDQIGLVSQNPLLVSATIEENIRYARPQATDQEIYEAAKAANCLEFIERFPEGFKTAVGERGMQLSGGQNQRIAIARAILKSPKILILDEATSNLDTASETLVQEALDRFMKGRTTLIIAHRLSTVVHADQIFVLDQGRIVQTGTHKDLSNDIKGAYYHLLKGQFLTQES
jgi:ABC-type multidrug transport system fused ATPase/permease subunit